MAAHHLLDVPDSAIVPRIGLWTKCNCSHSADDRLLLIMGIGADALWDGHTRAEAAASVLANGPHIYDLSR